MATTTRQDHEFGGAMLDPIIAWISTEMEPQDVFDKDALEAWAEANDWVKKEPE